MVQEGTGRYSKYITLIQSILGFIVVNFAYIMASIFDYNVVGFRWKFTWLIINMSFIPSCYYLAQLRYTRSLHIDRIAKQALMSIVIHMFFFFLILAFLNSWVHNISFYLWFYGILFLCLPLSWIIYRKTLKSYRRSGHNYRTVLIVGTGVTAVRLLDEMQEDPGYGFRVYGLVSTDSGCSHPSAVTSLDDLDNYLSSHVVNEIYYTLSGEDSETLQRIINIADKYFAQFYIVPPINRYITRYTPLYDMGGVPVFTIRPNPLHNPVNKLLKRSFDIVFSLSFLAVSPIIFIPVAIAIKLSSPGPVFFKQKRTGYQGNEFYCYKFRTMRCNSSADSQQAQKGDDRVTKVGHFLRSTSIDELPQFFNVLKGDMSIVGPRPHMLKHTEDYTKLISKYMVRHFIKPGITGWSQIKGFRGSTKELWMMEKRVENDVWYIEHWSFLLDLKIIAITALQAIKGDEHAY